MGGWKKVYVYYGIIFFGLGLIGFLFNSRLRFPELAQLTFDNFSSELADIGLIRSRESREVTISNPRLPIVFVSFINNGNGKYEALDEQMKLRIEERVPVIRYLVSEKEWARSNQTITLLRKYRFLMGLDHNESHENSDRVSIVFTVPKLIAAEFFNRLINQRPELPLFKLELISRQQSFLYRLSFGEATFSSGHLMKVIDILLDLWETSEHSLQRGNFGETFW